jgi:hypothetical protein
VAVLGLLASTLGVPGPLPAATSDFRENAVYDPAVPTPSDVLGFALGDRPVRYSEVVRYFEALAGASSRIVLDEYGRTHEGRPLVYAVVARPEHLARLEEIRGTRDRFADPRLADESVPAVDDLPAVAWMAYSIHGDELSSTDAALRLAYELTAGTDGAIERLLEDVVVLIDPLQNPDGRERYLSQLEFLNGVVPNPDPASLHHTAFWPWGRGNHYLFDLNRDWFSQVHPETRGRVAAIRDWKPQLVVDSHEMGTASTYLFPPPREPFNPHMHDWFWKWLDVFSDDQAAAFDRQGWSYYTREWNEEWFPGYGSSWVAFQGAVGILYEQSRTSGRVVKRPDGMEVEFRDAVHHQLLSSLANLETLARHRREILVDYREGRRAAAERGARGPLRAFLFEPVPYGARAARLAAVLENQGIEVHRAAEAFRAGDLHDVWGEDGSRELPAGALLVRLDQPLEPLIRTTLEFHTQMPDSFLASEREWLEVRDETRLYESSAWSLPLTYGLRTYWTGRIPDAKWERVGPPSPDWVRGVDAGGAPAAPPGAVVGDWPAYGLLVDVVQENALAAAASLLEAGLAVRCAEEEFRAGGYDYDAGSLLLRREANPDSLLDVARRVATETGTTFRSVPSARCERGPDLGGDRFRPLVAPRIAVLAGSPLSTSNYGSIWHLFDRELGVRVSSIDVARVATTDLRRYNVLVLPPVWGGPGGYSRALGGRGMDALREWVDDGGTLVGMATGAAFLADSSNAFSQVMLRRQHLDEHPTPRRGVPHDAARETWLSEAVGLGDETVARPEPPAGFGVPGAGDPLIGPGARAFAGEIGRRAAAAARARADAGGTTTGENGKDEIGNGRDDLETLEGIDARLRRFYPRGAILRVDLDPRRWLAFGLPERIAVPLYTTWAYLATEPVETVGRFADYDDLHVSGLLWPEAGGRWARTAYATREAKGRGQVILLAGNPVFRGTWLGTRRLLENAAILGPGMGAAADPVY